MATIPPMAWEVPILPPVDAWSQQVARHRKPFSPLSVRLGDDKYKMSLRAGLVTPHIPRHRRDEVAEVAS